GFFRLPRDRERGGLPADGSAASFEDDPSRWVVLRVRFALVPIDPAWLEEVSELLRIPSVSADASHRDDVRRAGAWICDFIRAAGGECELIENGGGPLAIGELRASSNADAAPTVLVYGHFDVQPPSPLEEWESPPFEP